MQTMKKYIYLDGLCHHQCCHKSPTPYSPTHMDKTIRPVKECTSIKNTLNMLVCLRPLPNSQIP